MADERPLPSLAGLAPRAPLGDCMPRDPSRFTAEELIAYVRQCGRDGAHLNPSHIALDRLRGYGLVHRLLNAIPDTQAQRVADAQKEAHAQMRAEAAREEAREEALARAAVAKWEAYTAERRREAEAKHAAEAGADRTHLIAMASLIWLLDVMRDRVVNSLAAVTPKGTSIALRAPSGTETDSWDFEFMLDAALQLADRAGLAAVPMGEPV